VKRWWIFPTLGFTCLLWIASSAREDLAKYVIHGYAQGTDYTITYYATDEYVRKQAIDSLLGVIDSSMSVYKSYSLINRINDQSGNCTFALDAHLYNVLKRSFTIYKDSKGIFDITVAPLVELWGFGVNPVNRVPDSNEIYKARLCVGMDKIRLRGRRLQKEEPCIQIDVNGIAQGYSVDVLAAFLESQDIPHYIVELGGELRVKGPKPDGSPIRVGIERFATRGDTPNIVINDVMEIATGAVTTAGNYRKFLQEGDRTFSHHIDPRTGYPFDRGIISATVYAEDAVTADGYDNVIVAMDAKQAISFVNSRKHIEAFIIYRDEAGIVRDTMSTGFKQLLATDMNRSGSINF